MITRADVAYVAQLSRVQLSAAELDQFVSHLQTMLDYVAQLNQVDTSKVEPTAHVLPLRNVGAPDTLRPSLERADALRSAPQTADGCFHVPPVIE